MTYLVRLGILASFATVASAAAFELGTPSTTCMYTVFGNTLTINVPGDGSSFSVTGALTITLKPVQPACSIVWIVDSEFNEPVAGNWINTSSFSGNLTILDPGWTVGFTETTEHAGEPGIGAAIAQSAPAFYGPVGAHHFAAGPVNGAPFADGPGDDILRQTFRIDIGDSMQGQISFEFPVYSSTSVPEPVAWPALLFAVGFLRYRKRR